MTTPRAQTLNDLDPLIAAGLVGTYLTPQTDGDWSIKPFTVSENDATIDRLRSLGDGGGRFTPAGDYLSLSNADGVMMSNTPDEQNDHRLFMELAAGRVLVSGLGLSCVVSGLLANDEVRHIDVIEKSEAVIRMVGPAFAAEPRVTIHHGDALTYEWPDDASWTFAWHDIWQTIAPNNLIAAEDADCPGYDQMLLRYAPLATYQGAWALDTSLLMQAAEALADERAEEWAARWRQTDEAGRREVLIDWHRLGNPVLDALGGGPTREAAEFMVEQTNWREQVKRDNMRFFIDAPPLIAEVRPQLAELLTNYYAGLGLAADRDWPQLAALAQRGPEPLTPVTR